MVFKKHVLFVVLLVLLNSSCGSYKNIPYFKNLDKTTRTVDTISNYSQLTIQSQDIIGVNVSSLNPEASAIFNYNLNRVNGNNYDTSTDNPVVGYLVDEKGQIDVPLIGSIKVAGCTTSELSEDLKIMLLTYLKEPIVNIRMLNFKISVLGDVLRPGVYTVQNERITITEALSLSGDLNITAIRNIVLIREIEGERQFVPIDLTSTEFFDSEYFYLKNNDVLYVPPDKTKFATVDRGYRVASILLSALSVIAIFFSALYR